MEGIEVLRKAIQKIAAKEAGKSEKIPRSFEGQIPADDFLHLLASLPVSPDNWAALQDALDGALFYVMGVDLLGDLPIGG